MVMVKIKLNKFRLDCIINNFIENLEDMEYAIGKYNSVDSDNLLEVRHISKSIRCSSVSFYKITEDYLGMCLKRVGVGVSDMNFKDCVNLAYSKGLITEDIRNYLITNVRIRNIDSHTYNQPSIEELINIFNKNKPILYSYLEFLKNLSNVGFDRNDNLSNFSGSNIFNKM